MTTGKAKIIRFDMSAEEFEQVDTLARLHGFRSRTAYVKSLIEKDGAAHGVPIKFPGTWGGWRGGKKPDESKE